MNALIDFVTYNCGHPEFQMMGAEHYLCLACDAHVIFLTGIPSEALRFAEWNDDLTLHRAECQCRKCAASRELHERVRGLR